MLRIVHKRERGFTLIELVIVIVLLGILAATALPKFLNVITSAKSAAIQGVASSLSAAVNITRAQWLLNPTATTSTTSVSSVSLDASTTIYVNNNGWAQCSSAAGSSGNYTCTNSGATACVEVWNTIMTNAPVACTSTTQATGCQYLASAGTAIITVGGTSTTSSGTTTTTGGTTIGGTAGTSGGTGAYCVYTLQGGGTTSGGVTTGNTIIYDYTTTGLVGVK